MGRWVRAERKPSANESTPKKSCLNLGDHDELIRLRKENKQLRMEREILKKAAVFYAPEGIRNRIKYRFIREQQKTYPVTVLCRVIQVSTNAYYAWCNNPPNNNKKHQDQQLADSVRQLFTDNKQRFGSRRLADRLQKQGFAVGRFKTRRIMRDLKLKVRYPKRIKLATDSNHREVISPNRLDRQFKVGSGSV